MKQKHYISLLLLLFLHYSFIYAQTHHAFIVAISQYPEHSEWWNINAHNDISVLIPQVEGQNFEITLLQNEQATKSNIMKGFSIFTDQLKKDDVVYIHFSCHGQQMEDDDGDEPDGWDEALIPYDAELSYEKGAYEGENHLRDDEFNKVLIKMRKKIESNGMAIVTLDACHSASATRDENDEEILRGTPRRFCPSGRIYEQRYSDNKHYTDTPLIDGDSLAPLIVISSCKSYQVNGEIERHGKKYGPLSYFLAKTFETESICSPERWIPVVIDLMKRNTKQTPVWESTMLLNL